MLHGFPSAGRPDAPAAAMTASPRAGKVRSSGQVTSLARLVRLLRDAHVSVSLFRFAGGRIDPLVLECGLEEALGRDGMVEPLEDGTVLAILPRFAEDAGRARWRVVGALGRVLAREALPQPLEIDVTELHCRADSVADSEDLLLQLLAAPHATIAILPMPDLPDADEALPAPARGKSR